VRARSSGGDGYRSRDCNWGEKGDCLWRTIRFEGTVMAIGSSPDSSTFSIFSGVVSLELNRDRKGRVLAGEGKGESRCGLMQYLGVSNDHCGGRRRFIPLI